MKFHKDVVIDLVCYRRLGHNEADEPAATQPIMYQMIRSKPTTRQIYAEQLVGEGVVSAADVAGDGRGVPPRLDEGKSQVRQALGLIGNKHTVDWSKYLDVDWTEPVRTGVRSSSCASSPARATAFRKASRCIARSRASSRTAARWRPASLPLDWGFAETLAYATLLDRRLRDPPDRPGQRARHVLPSPRRRARPEDRGGLHPA